MSVWDKFKYFLGLPCIAKFGDKYVITKRELGFLRVCLDRNSEYWWMKSGWNRYCAYDTLAGAKKRFEYVVDPSQPVDLKLSPLGTQS